MRWLEIGKVGVLGFLLGIIFALPTLTATRLVGVLGVSTISQPIQFHSSSNAGTFVTTDQGSLTISFVGSGIHRIGRLVNPTDQARIVTISVPSALDPALKSAAVDLTVGSAKYRLFDHKLTPNQSTLAVSLLPHQPVEVILDVTSSDPNVSYGTFHLEIGGI